MLFFCFFILRTLILLYSNNQLNCQKFRCLIVFIDLIENIIFQKIVYKIFSSTNNHMLIDFICGNNFAISSRNAIICTNKCILNQLNHECVEFFFPVLIISCDFYFNLLAFISNISLNKK